ncbi:response regulator transcription factor [Flavisolibacter sp. BT320]|nr:response regulator transcription factor [Flavisolibacter longurius]
MEVINVAVIDDHEVVINGLKAMFAGHKTIRISFTTTDGDTLLNHLDVQPADVLLMDIQMPGTNGVDLCKLALKKQPSLKILAFTSFDDSHYIRQVMRNGAMGYLLKNADQQTIVDAVHAVMEGNEFLDETVKKILLQESITGQRRSIFDIPLTKREKEILKLVAEGLSNQEIAGQLFISLRTVETHRLNLSQKLGAKNTAALVKEAIRRGLID